MSYNITSKTYALFIDNNITKIIEELGLEVEIEKNN